MVSSIGSPRSPSLALSVIAAVARHDNADEFCRQIILLGLNIEKLFAVCVLNLDAQLKLDVIGNCTASGIKFDFENLKLEVNKSLNSRNRESARSVSLPESFGPNSSAIIVPSFLPDTSSGVLAIIFEAKTDNPQLNSETLLALSFACEMYCSENWGNSTRSKFYKTINSAHEKTLDHLSDRQIAVLALIKDGRTNEAIARLLNFSLATIKKDIAAIFVFLGVRNRFDAVAISSANDTSEVPEN